MADSLARLTTALAARYQIERELGAGGMATVYLAEDLKHDRRVAVKVLRPELAATLGAERFLREIQIAASLTHPHILTLIDSGEADGFLYYVMPYVEGETLRDRLNRENQLPLDDAIQIAKEVAHALSHAHDHGVVHRDIKPENILLSAGEAVVADFGIARAIDAAGGEQLTETGLAIGTPAYMSPEQGAGSSELDARSDIYSLGCVLYEMLGGEPPYTGPTPQAVIAKRMSEPVPHVSTLRDTVPRPLEAAISKALAKTPTDRFTTAMEFAGALTAAAVAPTAERRWSGIYRVAAALGAVAVVVVGLALTVLRPNRSISRDELPRIAVLPFENLGAPEDEFFADGITEEITSRLAKISGLRVVSRTSALRYKGGEVSVEEIGRELNVQYLLEGTIRTDRSAGGAGQARVTPQLIRVADDVHLWTEPYTAALKPGEIFLVQAAIAEQVAGALNVTLLEPERQAVAAASTEDAEAYEAYLFGRSELRKRTPEAVQHAVELFNRAIARDTNFAAAYSGLADAFAASGVSGYRIFGFSNADAFERAESAARRAIALDSMLAEGHASLGIVRLRGAWDWAEAERALKRAIALDPDYARAHIYYAAYLRDSGRVELAVEEGQRAVALDPLSSAHRATFGAALMAARRDDEAVVQLLKGVELEPANPTPHFNLLRIYIDRGLLDDAVREAEMLGFPTTFAEAMIRALSGQTTPEVAAAVIGHAEQASPLITPLAAAGAYAKAGLTDSAFARLDAALRVREGQVTSIMSISWFDGLRSDPRYTDLLRRMGLASR